MIIKWLTGLIKGKKRREKAKVEIEELKKALLEDPKFRDEILRELEYRTGRRDLLKAGVLGLLGFTVGTVVGSEGVKATTQPVSSNPVNSNVVRDVVSDYAVKIPKPCTCIVAQDGTGDYDVSPGEDASEVIQKAIDYAHEKGGGEVRIREGDYYIDAHTIYVKDRVMLSLVYANLYIKNVSINSNVIIKGYNGKIILNGLCGQYLYIPNSNFSRVTNNNRVDGNTYIVLDNIEIDGRKFVGVRYNRIISFFNVNSLYVTNCYIHDGNNQLFEVYGCKNVFVERNVFKNAGKGICGVGVHNSQDVWIKDIKISNIEDIGLDISNGSKNVFISNAKINNCSSAIYIEVTVENMPVENVVIDSCICCNNHGDGIGIYSSVGDGLIRNVNIIGGIYTDNMRGIRSNGCDVIISSVNACKNKLVDIEVHKLYGHRPGKHEISGCIS